MAKQSDDAVEEDTPSEEKPKKARAPKRPGVATVGKPVLIGVVALTVVSQLITKFLG